MQNINVMNLKPCNIQTYVFTILSSSSSAIRHHSFKHYYKSYRDHVSGTRTVDMAMIYGLSSNSYLMKHYNMIIDEKLRK